MTKKIISAVLAAAMTVTSFSMVMAAPAALNTMEGAGTGAEVSGTSTTNLPVINITVPTTAALVVNPFQMAYDQDGVKGSDQIVSVKQDITSESNVALAVNVSALKATPAEGSGITIMTGTAAKATAKSAYVALAIGDASGTDALKTTYADIQAQVKDKKAVLVAAKNDANGASLANAYVIPAKTDAVQKASFILTGDVNANPTKKDTDGKTVIADPWKASDTIAVGFKFTFTPQIVQQTTTNP
jgi:hypothetical protein